MKLLRTLFLFISICVALIGLQSERVAAHSAAAVGDEFWDDRFYVSGPSDAVTMLGIYQNELIVGGLLRTAGKAVTNRIAKWNGAEWQAIGNPPISPVCGYRCYIFGKSLDVDASIVYNNKLIVGGTFAKGIIQWDDQSWEFVGGGLDGPTDSAVARCMIRVSALVMMGNDLYLGGCFYKPGTTTLVNLLRWDGTNWSEVNGGVENGVVYAMVAQGDELYVAGNFQLAGGIQVGGIAKWNRLTNEWSALGDNADHLQYLSKIIFYDGNLIVSHVNQMQLWDGAQWHDFIASENTKGEIYALAVRNNELYVGGNFETLDGNAINNIAIWDGTTWRALDKELVNGTVNTFLFDGDDMFVGGSFNEVDGKHALNVAKWDGTEWSGLLTPNAQGIVGAVSSVVAHATDVYVGGDFYWVGTARANGLAKWDTVSQTWTALGNASCSQDQCRVRVFSLAFEGDTLYVGGEFREIGGEPITNLAKWDGHQWSELGNWHWCCVKAIGVKNEMVYIGGTFPQVYQWNGHVWQGLGNFGYPYSTAYVNALTFWDSGLYAGGRFDTVTGQLTKNIARWDGTSWSDLGSNLQAEVNGLHAQGKRLLIAGWDGVYQLYANQWRALDKDSAYFLDVTRADGTIFASASSSDYDESTRGIVQWKNGKWESLGSGIALNPLNQGSGGGAANKVAVVGRQVFIGGYFQIVGDKPSHNFALWHNPAPLRSKLASPRNQTIISSKHAMLQWNVSEAATQYQVQLRAHNRRGKLLLDTTTSEITTQSPNLKRDKTYLWRVRACNNNDCSAWTNYWSFTTKP